MPPRQSIQPTSSTSSVAPPVYVDGSPDACLGSHPPPLRTTNHNSQDEETVVNLYRAIKNFRRHPPSTDTKRFFTVVFCCLSFHPRIRKTQPLSFKPYRPPTVLINLIYSLLSCCCINGRSACFSP